MPTAGLPRGTRPWLLLGSAWLAVLMAVALWAPAQRAPVVEALFVFYQPIVCFLFMLWLWAALVHFFEASQVRYEACFASEHLRHLLSGPSLVYVASVFTTVTAASLGVFVFAAARGDLALAAYQPGLLYAALLTLLVNPLDFVFDHLHSQQRWFFVNTLRRVVLPLQVVAFTDFLLADVLTSLAKPLSDLGLAFCHLASSRPLLLSLREGFNPDVCSNHSLQIPLVLILPYVWRFIQCLIVFVTEANTSQLFNAIKYSTAGPAIFLSFVKYSVSLPAWHAFWKPLWVAAAIFNTGYSFYWDVERDWDIRFFSNGANFALKPDVRMFGNDELYRALIAVNLVLRVAWTYKLASHLRHLRWFVMTMALLEIFRRFLWAFVRIENELRKVQGKQPTLGPLIPHSVSIGSLAGFAKRKSSAWSLSADTGGVELINRGGGSKADEL